MEIIALKMNDGSDVVAELIETNNTSITGITIIKNPVTFTFVPADDKMLLSVDKYLSYLTFNEETYIKNEFIISSYNPSVEIINYYLDCLDNLKETDKAILKYFSNLSAANKDSVVYH